MINPEMGQIILMNKPERQIMVLVLNSFPQHLLICEISPERIEGMKPVVLNNNHVRGLKLRIDFFINLLTLKIIRKDAVTRILGKINTVKLGQVLRRIDWIILGHLQFRRSRRESLSSS